MASSACRDTRTRGTPSRSSDAVSEPIPWAAPWLFTPTDGRQHTTVGEITRTGRSSGTSITTATLPRSPASQCSLCARIVASGTVTVKLEQRSAGGFGGARYPSLRWRNRRAPSGVSSIGSSSSNALIANSSSTGTIAPTDMPLRVAMNAGN